MSFVDDLICLILDLLATGDENQLIIFTPVFEWRNRAKKFKFLFSSPFIKPS